MAEQVSMVERLRELNRSTLENFRAAQRLKREMERAGLLADAALAPKPCPE